MDNSGGVLSDLVNSEAHVLEVRHFAVFESLHFGLSASADGAELSVKSLWMQTQWHLKWLCWMGRLALFVCKYCDDLLRVQGLWRRLQSLKPSPCTWQR